MSKLEPEADYGTKTERHDEMAETPSGRMLPARIPGGDAGSALGFGLLGLVGRCLRGGIVLHAIFQGTNPFAQTFAKLRQFLRTEDQQRNSKDNEQVHRLK